MVWGYILQDSLFFLEIMFELCSGLLTTSIFLFCILKVPHIFS